MTLFHNIIGTGNASKAGAPNLSLDCTPFLKGKLSVCLVSCASHTEAAEMGAS